MSEEDSVDKDVEEEGTPSERRGDVRHLACFPAHVETAEGVARSALIRDLSVSGALLLTRARLRIGDPIKLSLYLKEDAEPFACSGHVVREEKRPTELSHPWTKSVAVRFDEPLAELEPEAKALAERQAALAAKRS
jgi:hypothetical protein